MEPSRSQASRYSPPEHPDDGQYGVPVVSIGEWIVTFIILVIPLVNIIMVFVWAFGGGSTNPSKANFFRAYLLLAGIALVLVLGFGLLVGDSLP